MWGAIALDPPDPDDVDRALDRGCVGISLPAGALASVEALSRLRPLLARLERAGAPLLVHPGPGPGRLPGAVAGEPSLADPLWWSALTRYVSDMHAAWLAFVSAGRPSIRELRVVFSMLAGLAPLHAERLSSRGGPARCRTTRSSSTRPPPTAPRPCGASRRSSAPSSCSTARTGPSSTPASTACRPASTGMPISDGTRRALGAGERVGEPDELAPRAVARSAGRAPTRSGAVLRAAAARPGPVGAGARGVRRELADRPELWIELVKHDASQRVYEELLSDAHLTAWLICWMDDQDTGFHDHDVSAGAVAVVSGSVREERLAIGGQPRKRTFAAGDAFHFSAADIHRVRHGGADPAVTLHVYSPPLARMGAYVIGDDGVLARHTMPSSEELRPRAPRARPQRARRSLGVWLGAGAPLHAGLAGDQDQADHLRLEQAVLDDARRRAQPARQRARVLDGAQVVGDQAAVGASSARRAAPPDRACRASSARRTARARAARARTAARRPSPPRRSPRSGARPPRRSSRACARRRRP